jgi:flavin-dependent dehydrogenase
LALRGFKTLLLEEHETAAVKALCTGIIDTDAFREFPLPMDTVVGALTDVKVISRYGVEFRYTSPQPMAYMVDKGAFNLALAARHRGWRPPLHLHCARDLVIDDEGVHIIATGAGGQPLRLHAPMAVLACGVDYQLTNKIGLGRAREFLQGSQTDLPWTLMPCAEVHLNKELSPEAFAWIVPLDNGQTRVGVMRAHDARGALRQFLDRLAPQWRERQDIHLRSKSIAQTPLRRTFMERVLVIGGCWSGQDHDRRRIHYGLLRHGGSRND